MEDDKRREKAAAGCIYGEGALGYVPPLAYSLIVIVCYATAR